MNGNVGRGQLTTNFHIDEFKCNDGTSVPCEYILNVLQLAQNLQVLRDFIKKPITINSGYRTPSYNRGVGGKDKSRHLTGEAADIVVGGLTPKQVARIIEQFILEGKMSEGGLGVYPSFVHYDVRGYKARW